MKVKRIFTFILNLILVFSTLISTQITSIAATAQGAFALNFELNVDGKQVVTAKTGDVLTVSFTMRRTDADDGYKTNGFQNYIHYDLEFFEFVENSIDLRDSGGMPTAKRQASITYGEIIQCQNMGNSYVNPFVFCTFQLKVIATSGSGMVYNDEVCAFDTNFQSVTVTKQNLQVMIDTQCTHPNKTKVDAQPSTCTEQGWETYYDCDDCDAIFDASGENLISDIPYLEKAHSFGETMTYDETGHWYECTVCEEKSGYSIHVGGEATCSNKAVCIVCNQEYGSLNPSNHAGESVLKHDETGHWYECTACEEKSGYAAHEGGEATCSHKAKCDVCQREYGELDADNHGESVLKNEKGATLWKEGYTGDKYCADCQELLEQGEPVKSLLALPWYVWLAIVLLLLIVMSIVLDK